MESNPDVLAFTSYKVDPKIIERIKNDPQLNDIKNYLNKNPSLHPWRFKMAPFYILEKIT